MNNKTYAYSTTFTKLFTPFKNRLLEAYKTQEWATIWADLNKCAVAKETCDRHKEIMP